MPEPISVLIVDDEKPARQKIRMFLTGEPDFKIAGEAGDGLEALRLIREIKPQLVFLDIQMPGLTGFELIDALDSEDFPYVIFTTAFDEHALKAFEVHAVDYLLKPFAQDRFQQSLQEFRSRHASQHRVLELLQTIYSTGSFLQRVLIRDGERVFPLRLADVSRISAEEKYVRLHVEKRTYLHRASLSGLAERLDPARFARIHRGEIVNLDFIAELQSWTHGDYIVVLKDGTRIPLSRTYREQVLKSLGA
jgi:two-component system, LytTR family, response regulator